MANDVVTGSTGLPTAHVAPAAARRAWPRWLALGLLLLAVAVAGVVWADGGARLLLGVIAAAAVIRGALLIRAARSLGGQARRVGVLAVLGGIPPALIAALSAELSGWVLLVAVPALLLVVSLAVLARGAAGRRRAGLALLAWSMLVGGLLVATGLARGAAEAAQLAAVLTALGLAVLAVPVLIGAATLRRAAGSPPEVRPAGCAGCACGAGGCRA